jgi:methylmalonyl-CoA epimerase
MKVKRVEHIAIAVRDLESAKRIFEEKLGLAMEYEEELPQYGTKLAMYPVRETYLELLQAMREGTETDRWIAERGEGLYHICLEVEDIQGALTELRAKGVGLLDERPRVGHGNTRIAFLDPRSTANVLIELVEIPPKPAQ